MAARAVISDPPRSRLSTTTRTSLRAARMRLRIGKRNASGAVPGGHSDSSSPGRRSPSTVRRAGGGRHVGAVAHDGDGAAVGHASTPDGPTRRCPSPARRRPRRPPRRGRVRAPMPSPARLRGVARPDDPGATAVEHLEVAAHEEHGGRFGIVAQDGGKASSRVRRRVPRPGTGRPTPRRAPGRRRPPRHADVRRAAGATGAGGARPAATAYASSGSWWASSMRSRATASGRTRPAPPAADGRAITPPAPTRRPEAGAQRQGHLDVLDVDEVGRPSPRRRRGRRSSWPPVGSGGTRGRSGDHARSPP